MSMFWSKITYNFRDIVVIQANDINIFIFMLAGVTAAIYRR